MARGSHSSEVMLMASPSQPDNGVPTGALKAWSTSGEYNNLAFIIGQAISKLQTATLVRVDKCTNDGDTSPVGFVNVTPLVNQIDAQGNPTPHVTIYNVPYLRVQGGNNAVIIDPQVGDIGVCVFASRDISKIKSTKKQGNPGSHRQYNFSDGMYLGGMLNAAPTQFVQFNADGITITGSAVTINADVQINGSLTATGDVIAGSISLENHVHGGVQRGSSNTDGPS